MPDAARFPGPEEFEAAIARAARAAGRDGESLARMARNVEPLIRANARIAAMLRGWPGRSTDPGPTPDA